MKKTFIIPLLIILFVVINIFLLLSGGTVDARNFEAMFRDMMSLGPGYIPKCMNYLCPSSLILAKFPPGYFLLFYLLSFVFPPRIFGSLITLKLVIFSFYILTIVAAIWFARLVQTKNMSTLGIVAIFLSLVSLILNTQALAYTDVVTFPFVILGAAYFLRKKYLLAGLLFGTGCFLKWQPVILLPVFVLYILANYRLKDGVISLVRFAFGLIIPILLMVPADHTVLQGFWISLVNAMGHYASVALNIPWIMQWTPLGFTTLNAEGSPSQTVIWIQTWMFIIAYALILWRLVRTKDLLMSLFVAVTAYYLLAPGVHENHFILGTILALLIYLALPNKKNLIILRAVDGVNFLNMFFFYGLIGTPLVPKVVWGIDLSLVAAILISSAGIVYLFRWYFPKTTRLRERLYTCRSFISRIALAVTGLVLGLVMLEVMFWVLGIGYSMSHGQNTSVDGSLYRIVAIGESTTAQMSAPAWPELLEIELNKRVGKKFFQVYNLGVPGTNTSLILSRLPADLDQYRPNMVISMMGINDEKYFALPPVALSWKDRLWTMVTQTRVYKFMAILFRLAGSAGQKELIARAMQCRTSDGLGNDIWAKDYAPRYEALMRAEYPANFSGQMRQQQQDKKAEALLVSFMNAHPFSYNAAEVIVRFYAERSDWANVLVWSQKLQDTMPFIRLCISTESDSAVHKSEQLRLLGDIGTEIESLRSLTKKVITLDSSNSPYYEQIHLVLDPWSKSSNVDTQHDYRLFAQMLLEHHIRLIAMQYPLLSVSDMEIYLNYSPSVTYVSNEDNFQEALRIHPYNDLFTDNFAGIFGHTTMLGSSLIASRAADAVLRTLNMQNGR